MQQSQIDSIVLNHLLPRRTETMPLFKARERHLAQHLLASENVPAKAQARCRGLAIAIEDWQAGTRIFKLGHRLDNTPSSHLALAQNGYMVEAGDNLPPRCNCVIAEGDFEILDQTILINPHVQLHRWHLVSQPGSECQSGDILVPNGQRLAPFEWALASLDADASSQEIGVIRANRLIWIDWQEDFSETSEADLSAHLYKQRLIEATLKDFQLEMHRYQRVRGTMSELMQQISEHMDENILIVVSGLDQHDQLVRSSEGLATLGFSNRLAHLPYRLRQLPYFGSNPQAATLCLSGSRVFDAMVLLRRFMIPFLQASIQANSQAFQQNATARILNPETLKQSDESFLPAHISCNEQGILVAMIDLDGIEDPWRLRKSNALIDVTQAKRNPDHPCASTWFWRPQCF